MNKEMKFEEAMERMEEIVRELEDGKLELDTSLEKFEEGIRLYRYCLKKLQQIEGRVTVILNDGNGQAQSFDMDTEEN
jgi:exodeoxyribonuclease VII small subunit